MSILGVDPRNDYAFKCVFGSEHHTCVLVHMLNAVLKPPPGRRVVSVQILNPITELMVLDDKLSILDVRARDQSGRSFNVEMQMTLPASLRERLLYYWARLYSSQLCAGNDYNLLAPTVSICFLDGLLFPHVQDYHLSFGLWETRAQLLFSDHLAVHLFQLPRFTKCAEELRDPLDVWLYFLNNGKGLDPVNLPEALRQPEVEEAIEVLKKVTQEERERVMYESREKMRLDALSRERERERMDRQQAEITQSKANLEQQRVEVEQQWVEVEQQRVEVEQQRVVVEQQRVEVEQQRVEVEQQRVEVEQQRVEVEQQKTEVERKVAEVGQREATALAQGLAKGLMGQVRLCERFLQRTPLPDEQLAAMSVDELTKLVDVLGRQTAN